MRRLTALLVLASLLVAGCGGDDSPEGLTVQGVVVAVDGDLTGVESFTVVDAAGDEHVFVPTEGLTFDDGPLSHLSAHLTSGEPVLVTYEETAEGLVAVDVTDA